MYGISPLTALCGLNFTMVDYMEANERLKVVVDRVEEGNQRRFADRCGLQYATVNRLLKGVFKMSEHYVREICKAYPNVNPDFLRGEADAPFFVEPVPESEKDAELERLRHENAVLRWVIQQFGNKAVDTP